LIIPALRALDAKVVTKCCRNVALVNLGFTQIHVSWGMRAEMAENVTPADDLSPNSAALIV
jgi:hypothetical protein